VKIALDIRIGDIKYCPQDEEKLQSALLKLLVAQ